MVLVVVVVVVVVDVVIIRIYGRSIVSGKNVKRRSSSGSSSSRSLTTNSHRMRLQSVNRAFTWMQ